MLLRIISDLHTLKPKRSTLEIGVRLFFHDELKIVSEGKCGLYEYASSMYPFALLLFFYVLDWVNFNTC
jgi:hypothetical protein